MIWSAEQDAALTAVSRWLRDASQPVFTLFGYAGTGKTTLARHLADGIEGDVVFGAFTGKAAMVLRQKGCRDARTLHSLIYRARDTDTDQPSFVLNDDSAVSKASLIVIDECSMVDEALGRDLMSFGKPILVLGDPAQLPPVQGGGFFTAREPDMMLTDVHRQAAGNAIIRLSMQIRAGERPAYGQHGEVNVVGRGAIDATAVTKADQVLVGLNRTRNGYNRRLRELFGYADPYPQVGDRLVCLRNNRQKGLLNGSLWSVEQRAASKANLITMRVRPDEDRGAKLVKISVRPEFFTGGSETLTPMQRREHDEFDYGYALTVHKAQGSQWDDVVLFDESGAFRDHRQQWLYTGVTRAAETLTVVM